MTRSLTLLGIMGLALAHQQSPMAEASLEGSLDLAEVESESMRRASSGTHDCRKVKAEY